MSQPVHIAYLGFLLLSVVSSESGLAHHGHFCHCSPTFGQQAGSIACVELGGPGRRILPLIRNQIHCLVHPREWCASPTVVHAGKTFPLSPHGLPGLAPVLKRSNWLKSFTKTRASGANGSRNPNQGLKILPFCPGWL